MLALVVQASACLVRALDNRQAAVPFTGPEMLPDGGYIDNAVLCTHTCSRRASTDDSEDQVIQESASTKGIMCR